MFAFILILAFYLAVPITLATAALLRPQVAMRWETVPVKVSGADRRVAQRLRLPRTA